MINITDVSASYGKKRALNHVNLSLKGGDFHAIFGPDHSGKTTLLNILMGLLTHYKGQAKLFGKDTNKFSPKERGMVRYVPYDVIWLPKMTAVQYFKFCQKKNTAYDTALQKELCEEYSIPVQKLLSRMERQENKLVQIIAAICAHPKLLILDEPKDYLTVPVYRKLLKYLQNLNKSGTSILIAVKYYDDIEGYCSHYTYLKQGNILTSQKAVLKDIRDKVVTIYGGNEEYLKQYMGQQLSEYMKRKSFLYQGDMKELTSILKQTGADNWYAGILLIIRISGLGILTQNLIFLGAMVCLLFASVSYMYTVYSHKKQSVECLDFVFCS